MPRGMKNVTYFEYSGFGNWFGAKKANWIRNEGSSSARCTDVSSSNCPLYSWAEGDYNVIYTDPTDIGKCYEELHNYILHNYPEDLSIENACENIKCLIDEANPNDPSASQDVNSGTVTREIKIIELPTIGN